MIGGIGRRIQTSGTGHKSFGDRSPLLYLMARGVLGSKKHGLRCTLWGYLFKIQAGRSDKGIISVVDYKAGGAACGFFNVFALNVINLHFFAAAALGVPGSDGPCFLKGAVRKLSSLCFHHNMGTGNALGVEPPVAAACDFEGDFLILVIIFADIDVEAVRGQVVIGAAGNFCLFAVEVPLFDKAKFCQLLLNGKSLAFSATFS